MVMQLFADIFNMPVHVSSATQACALGAAIYAAAAAKLYPDVQSAMENMAGKTAKSYTPQAENAEAYKSIYRRYSELAE